MCPTQYQFEQRFDHERGHQQNQLFLEDEFLDSWKQVSAKTQKDAEDQVEDDDDECDIHFQQSHITESSASGTLKYKLMYIPSILAKRHLIRKLARFGKLSYFEFIPGEFSNKIAPEVLEQNKTKFQDFKGAEFKFELEYSEKLFVGVKRLRVKGLQIKVIPPPDLGKELVNAEQQDKPLIIARKEAKFTKLKVNGTQLDVQHLQDVIDASNRSKSPKVEHVNTLIMCNSHEGIQYCSEDRQKFELKPTQTAYHHLDHNSQSNRRFRFSDKSQMAEQSLIRDESQPKNIPTQIYRFNKLDKARRNIFLSRYQRARNIQAQMVMNPTGGHYPLRK
jgi:hypothetical protein